MCGNHGGQASPASRVTRSIQQGRPDPCDHVRTQQGERQRSPKRESAIARTCRPCGAPPCGAPPCGAPPCGAPPCGAPRCGAPPSSARRCWDPPQGSNPRFENSCPSVPWVPAVSQGSDLPAVERRREPRPEVCPRDFLHTRGGLACRIAGSNVLSGAPARTLTRFLARRVLGDLRRSVHKPGSGTHIACLTPIYARRLSSDSWRSPLRSRSSRARLRSRPPP